MTRIKAAIENLTKESHRIAQVMYEAAKDQGGEAGPGGDGAGQATGGAEEAEVVDAEFEDK